MKRLITLCLLATTWGAMAQVPTNGLIDYWKLNGNRNNSVSGRDMLDVPNFYVCNNFGSNPQYFYQFSNTHFKPGPTPNDSNGYYTHTAYFNVSYDCYNMFGYYTYTISDYYQTYFQTIPSYNFGTQSRSIAMWVKRYTLNDATHWDIPFFVGTNSGNQGFTMQMNFDTVYLATYGNLLKVEGPNDTLWHHYAGVYGSDSLYLYIDGIKIQSSYAPGVNTASSEIYFGMYSNMIIDNILVYNRQLTSGEVSNIYFNCPNENPVVSASGSGLTVDLAGDSYQWIDCDNNQPINGATQQNFTPSMNGDYAVRVSIGNCEYLSNCYTIANASINENKLYNAKIFPNPASNEFTISNLESGTQLSILDMTGKVVHAELINSNNHVISVANLANGVYIVKLEINGITSQKKLVVKK